MPGTEYEEVLRIPKFNDMHVHLRRGEMLKLVAPFTAAHCGMAIIMPNTTPGIFTGDDAAAYRQEIMDALQPNSDFNPLMTIKLRDTTTSEEILDARIKGVVAAKVYPAGVTTNSDDGVQNIDNLNATFKAMAACGMVLCIHGEMPGEPCLEREKAYLHKILGIAKKHPELKVVAEHITNEDTVLAIRDSNLDNLAATITLHHLEITLDDVIGGMLRPHLFCKPIAKHANDREQLRKAALGFYGDKFFLGSDTAPHAIHTKECAFCCAGVFTAPVLGQGLIRFFEREVPLYGQSFMKSWPAHLLNFACSNGPRFYGIKPSTQIISFGKKAWKVPKTYGNVVPFYANEELPWQMLED